MSSMANRNLAIVDYRYLNFKNAVKDLFIEKFLSLEDAIAYALCCIFLNTRTNQTATGASIDCLVKSNT
ncbi:hypothetical protein H6G04_01620 [Calothrix membranacea FACHB-236]|nr:hypothetical protein [Calothrix membranacea FACHB-236]